MRHRVTGKKLNRDKDHRRSLIKNLASSLILNGRIETSITKAKFIRPLVEKLVTKAKDSSFHNLKIVRSKLGNEEALRKLFSEIAPANKYRNGGYTRIMRTGKIQKGDNSELAIIEFLDKNIVTSEDKKKSSKKSVTPEVNNVDSEVLENTEKAA